jgi:hypothetical protein
VKVPALRCTADALHSVRDTSVMSNKHPYSRGAKRVRVFATTTPSQKLNRSREEKRGERSAERRNPTIVRRANKCAQRAPLVCVRGGGAPQNALLAQRLCLRGALAFRRTAAALVRALTS